MTTQIRTSTPTRYSLEFIVLAEMPAEQPVQYTAYDFGFELEAEEVGQAMTAKVSNGSFDHAQQVEPEEFEAIYQWFFS